MRPRLTSPRHAFAHIALVASLGSTLGCGTDAHDVEPGDRAATPEGAEGELSQLDPSHATVDAGEGSLDDTPDCLTPTPDGGDTEPFDCTRAIDCPGHFFIESQADLADVARCREIQGEISINSAEDPGVSPIVDLTPLRCLEKVTGRIHIQYSDQLTTLHGLERLRDVGSLEIEGMVALETLDGLEGLEQVIENISINSENSSLVDVSALEGVTLHGALHLERAPRLSRCAVDVLVAALEAHGARTDAVFVGDVSQCDAPHACNGRTCE